jgi:hypothetical protein
MFSLTLSLTARQSDAALDAAAADYLYSIWQAEGRRQAG